MKAVTLTGAAGILAAVGTYGVSSGLISQSALSSIKAAQTGSATTPATPATTPTSSTPTPVPNTVAATQVGINLGAPSYYSWEFAFADLIRNNGQLYYEPDGQPFTNQLPSVDGRPINVPIGTGFQMPMLDGPYVPAGTYNCTISPGWMVQGMFSLSGLKQTGTTFTFTIPKNPTNWPVYKMRLQATVNNARLDTLGCSRADLPAGTLFNPVWINDMKNFGVARFMDWGQTNNNPPGTWATRPGSNYYSQATLKGVSLEYQVEAANQLDTDPWINIPYSADDDYVRKFAIYIRDHLSSKHKVYIEYSNEMWNTGFYAAQQAVALGKPLYKDSSGDFQSGDYWYCDRVRQIMAIVSDVFSGQKQRVVRVLGVQAVWPLRAERMLQHNDTWKSVDMVVSAPYFTHDVNSYKGSGKARVDQIFANAPADVDDTISWAVQTKAVANRYGLQFGAYEAGQHYFSYDQGVGADIGTAENDPRMYDIYMRFLTKWKQQVGGPLTLYSGTGAGLFPMLLYTGQPVSQSPKMRAVQDFIKTLPSNK